MISPIFPFYVYTVYIYIYFKKKESSSHGFPISRFSDFQIVPWPSNFHVEKKAENHHLVGCHSSHAAGASDARQGHGLKKEKPGVRWSLVGG